MYYQPLFGLRKTLSKTLLYIYKVF